MEGCMGGETSFCGEYVQCMHTLKAGGSVQTAQTNGKGSELTSG